MSSSPPSPGEKFDFVLIDAECSTDGALNQVKHKIKAGKDTATDSIRDKLLEEESLTSLQLKLLSNGFANLKDGGSLVYSTCSLSENQNENVVRAFLSSHPDAYIANVDFEASTPPPQYQGLSLERCDSNQPLALLISLKNPFLGPVSSSARLPKVVRKVTRNAPPLHKRKNYLTSHLR